MLQFELNTAKEHPEIASTFEQISWQILFVKICSKLRACGQVDAEATLLPPPRGRLGGSLPESTAPLMYIFIELTHSSFIHAQARNQTESAT
jgi:hypothetical protein